MVKAQETLLDHLGIKKLLCATGGSMGGMQLLEFCTIFPNKTFSQNLSKTGKLSGVKQPKPPEGPCLY